ncbi:MAG TPA: GNAT family N-acetyltransferase [Polyangiaceae bacterium]
MNTAYAARQVLPEAVEAHVIELWKQTRSKPVELERTFRWYYRDDADRGNRCFVLLHGGDAELVGATGVGVRRFQAFGKSVDAALLGDFFVHKAHRSLFPALSLQRAAADAARANAAFVYGFPNQKALPVFRRLGFAELGRVRRFVRVLDYTPYLARHLKRPWLTRVVARPLNALLPLRRPPSWLPSKTRRYAWLTRFDERMDALERESRMGVAVRGQHTAAFLNWRFCAKPGFEGRTLALFDARTDALSAYAVVEEAPEAAYVRDLYGRTWNDVGHLLCRLERELQRARAASISMNLVGAPELVTRLARLGYAERPSTRTVILSAAAASRPELSDAAHWYLTDADEDQ